MGSVYRQGGHMKTIYKNYADSIPSLLCLILGIDEQTDLYTKYNISPLDSVAAIDRKVWRIFEFELNL